MNGWEGGGHQNGDNQSRSERTGYREAVGRLRRNLTNTKQLFQGLKMAALPQDCAFQSPSLASKEQVAYSKLLGPFQLSIY